MDLLYLVIRVLLILPASIDAVKIGISKLSTTTIEPRILLNDSDTTTTTVSPLSTTALNTESSTIKISENETTKTLPQFPPKIATPTKSVEITTSKPITVTQKAVENETSSNLTTTDFTGLEHPSAFFCSCDILPATCDINCCCDLDCPEEILKVFDCFSATQYPNLKQVLNHFQYEHGLPSCKINDGWLCVFRTNTRPIAKKEYYFDFDTKNNYKWPPSLTELTDVQENERDFYIYGDRLKVVNVDAAEIQDFLMPYDYRPPLCEISVPIRHLVSSSRNCLITSYADAQELKRKFLDFATTMKLLRAPKHQLTYLESDKTLFIDMALKSCNRNVASCTKLGNVVNDTEAPEYENSFISEIRIKIFHNYTNLIGCQLEFVEEELLESEDPIELWQKYSVDFIAYNETDIKQVIGEYNKELPFSFSGPLGYLQGKPLIVSKYIESTFSGNHNEQNQSFDFFNRPDIENNTLTLPSQEAGLCHKQFSKDYIINYGISSINKCTLRIAKESMLKINSNALRKSNYTKVCAQLQQVISEELFNKHAKNQLKDLAELYVSMLGRPKNASDKWLPLDVRNLKFPPILGQMNLEAKTLICRNILISAAYEFHIGEFTEQGISRQAIVKNAVLNVGPRHDLEFAFDEHFEIPLTLTVMFYDLSLNTASMFGEGPLYLALIVFSYILILIF